MANISKNNIIYLLKSIRDSLGSLAFKSKIEKSDLGDDVVTGLSGKQSFHLSDDGTLEIVSSSSDNSEV